MDFFFSVCIILEEKPAQAFLFFSLFLSFAVWIFWDRQEVVSWSLPVFFLFFWVGIFNSVWCVPLSWIFVFFFWLFLLCVGRIRRKNPSAAALRSFFFDSDVKNGGFSFLSFPFLLGCLGFFFSDFWGIVLLRRFLSTVLRTAAAAGVSLSFGCFFFFSSFCSSLLAVFFI